MLTHKILTRADVGDAASYYEDAADDYYASEGEASAWQGRGATALGLSGPVGQKRLRELLAGHVDPKEPPSRSATRHDSQKRIGIDFTFSAPKSVSIQALLGADAAIVRAHDTAVERAIALAENRAQARRKIRGKSHVENTRNLVVARFRHEMSRERDPQLHTHALILNLTQRRDGRWRALHNEQLVKATKYLGAVYRAELATELLRLGYTLRHDRGGLFELAHISRRQLEAFSARSAQIEDRLAENGLSRRNATTEQKQLATLQTRQRKTAVDRAALYADWRRRATDLQIDLRTARSDPSYQTASGVQIDPPGLEPPGKPLDATRHDEHVRSEASKAAVRYAVHHLTERQAIVDRSTLLDVALKHAMGAAQIVDIEREVTHRVKQGYLIEESPLYRSAGAAAKPARSRSAWIQAVVDSGLERGPARSRVDAAISAGALVPQEKRYTTQTALEREKRILQIERDGRSQVTPISPAEAVRLRLSSSRLSMGQRAAVELIATTPHQIVGVQGYAGTGKSHMLEQAKTLVEENGHKVVALAPYATQVRALRELGVESRTLASFLAAREKYLDSKTVLVIDEAGTVPTRQMQQVIKLAEEAGARVVLLGDTRQTKAVEAGRPFDQLQQAGMDTALMSQIERQKDPALREAVTLGAKGEAAASLAHIRAVREIPHDEERHATIADDYARMPAEERARTIIVAGTNDARREINELVRERLGMAGQGRVFDTLTRRDTTQAERLFSRNYSVGDVIQPERDYPRRGLQRGKLYRVLENGPGNRLTVRSETGKSITFNPYTNRKLSVYLPEHTELATGDRVRITRNDAALDLANGDRATVRAVSAERITIALDDQRLIELPADKALHFDLAYATTVHSSQGTTAERVLIDATTKSRTTTKDVYYVAISRARNEARIYTDDLRALPAAISRENVKHSALDLVREPPRSLQLRRNDEFQP